jgi:hypothetical protein
MKPPFQCALLLLVSVIYADAFSCGSCANGGPPPMSPNELVLTCSGTQATITAIQVIPCGVCFNTLCNLLNVGPDILQFASYGTPTGACGNYHVGGCNAMNSTAVVSAACVGQHTCAVWPNTTTFGDPCFGTSKVLTVQFSCSDGGDGTASCLDGPGAGNATVSATVDFSTALCTGVTIPSLQV